MPAPARSAVPAFRPNRAMLIACGVCLSFVAGFGGAMWLDASPANDDDPPEGTVWPALSNSFPQELNLLGSEPIVIPVAAFAQGLATSAARPGAPIVASSKEQDGEGSAGRRQISCE